MRKLLGVILGISLPAGCNSGRSHVSEGPQAAGWVVVLPGVDGYGWHNRAICRGLADGGVDSAIETIDWTLLGRWSALYNLRAERRNRRKAAEIAQRIAARQDARPDEPVILVGTSGGGAMAVWVAEALGEGRRVDGIILLAPALSPGYRLDKALANSRRGIVSFHSRWDWFFLGLGTTLFGTADGPHRSAAGRVGFQPPPEAAEGHYRKLFQVPWRPAMKQQHHRGGHLSATAAPFVAKYVAPLVRAESWDEQLIESLGDGGAQQSAADR